jgi:hypothetical protein
LKKIGLFLLRRILTGSCVEPSEAGRKPARKDPKETHMKKFQLFSVFAAVTALSGAALAGGHGHGPGGGGMFKHLDKNTDGKVTLAEAQAGAQERFTAMDKNKDGAVTQAELEGRGHRLLKKADANNDGKVTLAEMQAQSTVFFSRFDTNNDKVITKEELAAARGNRHCPKS